MENLENFIEKYLKNKKATDYEGWLALYGEDTATPYRERIAEADSTYQKARADHGRRAAALHQNGLSGSGYSDYLNHTAYAKRAESQYRAAEERNHAEEKNRRGYLAYLTELYEAEEAETAKATEKEQSVFSSLLAKRLTDENAAVTFLTANGIEEERARELAKESITILRGSKSYRDQIISKASYLNMDYNTAYNYAIMQGVPEETARMIAGISSYARQYYYSNQNRYN